MFVSVLVGDSISYLHFHISSFDCSHRPRPCILLTTTPHPPFSPTDHIAPCNLYSHSSHGYLSKPSRTAAHPSRNPEIRLSPLPYRKPRRLILQTTKPYRRIPIA